MMVMHRAKALAAFDRTITQAEREEAFQAAATIMDCIDSVCAAHLDSDRHQNIRRQILMKLENNKEAAVAVKVMTDWVEHVIPGEGV